jgi:uncharacterized protein YndB with AHSA1/START domain
MSATNDSSGQGPLREVTITRTFAAPRELVFKAWTDPQHLMQWWGPHEFTNPYVEVDPRPGGVFDIDMRGPDGMVYPNRGFYEEVVAPERLVLTSAWVDDQGNSFLEDRTTVTLVERDGKTELTLHAVLAKAVPEAAGAAEGMEEGWSQSLERLQEHLEARGRLTAERPTKIMAEPGSPEIRITREFEAPRELVFRVITDPQLVSQWWGPAYLTTEVQEMDVRSGGKWRFLQRDPEGTEYLFYGEYREVSPPERLVQSFEFAGMEGHGSLDSLVLVEREGKTIWTSTSVFANVEDRDAMIQSGMEEGVHETYDRLAEVLAGKEGGERESQRKAA